MSVIGPIRAPTKLPDLKQPRLYTRASFFLPIPNVTAAGLERVRELGTISLAGLPGNLVHERELGSPLVVVPSALLRGTRPREHPRYGAEFERVSTPFYVLQAQEVSTPGIARERALGFFVLTSNPFGPEGIVHERAIGEHSVIVSTQPLLNSLLRERVLGPILLAFQTQEPVDSPTLRRYWHRSLRGVRRRAPWD